MSSSRPPRTAGGRRASRMCRSASIGVRACAHTGPLSRPAVSAMIETPVCASPAMIARSIGRRTRASAAAATGCTLSIGWSDSSGSLIRAPNAQTTTASGRAGGDLRSRLLAVDRLGLGERQAELARGLGHRGRGGQRRPRPRGRSGRVTTSAGGAARRPARAGCRRRSPRCRGRPSARALRRPTGPRAATRIACLRCSREVRSRMSTPSRWSISCWMTRASSPDASIRISSPFSSWARTRTWIGRSTSTCTDGQAQAALLHALGLLARPLDLGVDERGHRRLGVGPVDEQAVQHAHLGGGEADAERVLHEQPHARDLVAQGVVEAVHRPGLGAQHRIAVLAHVGQRRAPACGDLGIEFGLGLGLAFGDLRPLRSSSSAIARKVYSVGY